MKFINLILGILLILIILLGIFLILNASLGSPIISYNVAHYLSYGVLGFVIGIVIPLVIYALYERKEDKIFRAKVDKIFDNGTSLRSKRKYTRI